jgi:hypothetical protein
MTGEPRIESSSAASSENQSSWLAKTGDWISSSAADAWSATKGAARVGGQVAMGVAEQIYEHPLQTAGQVAGTALAIGLIAEAGVGTAGAVAIAAVPAAGYGLYRGAQIAAKEGFSAIPGHIKETYQEGKAALSSAADAAATVYRGNSSPADMQIADAKLQNVGRVATPFLVGAVGGAGGEIGQAAVRTSERAILSLSSKISRGSSTLPELTIESGTAGAAAGAAAAGATGMESSRLISAAAKAAGKSNVAAGSSAVGDASPASMNRLSLDDVATVGQIATIDGSGDFGLRGVKQRNR